jgi:hypothetical protein
MNHPETAYREAVLGGKIILKEDFKREAREKVRGYTGELPLSLILGEKYHAHQ